MIVKGKVSNFSVFLLSLIIIVINEPRLSIMFGGAGILLMMGIFLIVNIGRYIQNGKVKSGAMLLVVLYLLLEIFYELLGISDCGYIYYYYTISFFFFAFAMTPIVTKLSKKQRYVLQFVIVASVLIAMGTNISLSIRYGVYYIRLTDYYEEATNVISTQYVSALVLFCGLLLTKIKFSTKNKIPYIVMLVFSVYFIITVGQRLTAILLLFIVLILQMVCSGEKTATKYLGYILLVIIGVFLILNYESILKQVIAIRNNDRVTQRINQLMYALKSGEIEGAGGSLEVRFRLMTNSLHTFVSSLPNFLFGAGEHRAANNLIGHHSQWLDQAGKFGVIGCVLMFVTLKKCFRDLRDALGLKDNRPLLLQYLIFLGFFVVRGLIGNVLYPYFGIMLFVLLPIVFIGIEEKKYSATGGQNDSINV